MSEIHVEEHSSPIRTPKQLIVVVALAFLVPIVLIVIISQLVTSGSYSKDHPAMSEESIAKRLQPVGTVVVDPDQPKPEASAPPAVAAAPAPTTPAPGGAAAGGKGEAVYKASCTVCHAAGVAGAPKTGDKSAWAPRIQAGMDSLYASSLKGKNAMPPKGGNLALSDGDVKAAVDYMVGLAK